MSRDQITTDPVFSELFSNDFSNDFSKERNKSVSRFFLGGGQRVLCLSIPAGHQIPCGFSLRRKTRGKELILTVLQTLSAYRLQEE